ncbi:hypothetical protein, partial [Rhodococcus chondri]
MTHPIGPDVPATDPLHTIVRALRGAIASVEAAIVRLRGEDVEPDTVERVLALAQAPDLGDVVGHHNTLTRAVAIVDHTATLTDADWAPIADLGPLLTEAVTRLREHAGDLLDGVDPDATMAAHVAYVQKIAADGLLGETLQLLVLVEDCLFMWQRLCLERARSTNPEALADVRGVARAVLADHFERDGDLLRRARRALARCAEGAPFEVVRRLSPGRTKRTLAQLRADLDDVRSACRADDAGWLADEAPEIADTLDSIDSPLKT